jgi:hypothetical protein
MSATKLSATWRPTATALEERVSTWKASSGCHTCDPRASPRCDAQPRLTHLRQQHVQERHQHRDGHDDVVHCVNRRRCPASNL